MQSDVLGCLVYKNGLQKGTEYWHEADLVFVALKYLIDDVFEHVGPSGLHDLLEKLQQLLQLGHLDIEAVAPLLHLHQVHQTEEAVLFRLQVLAEHIHEIIHPLAVANFKIKLGIGIKHIIEGVHARGRINFILLQLGPGPRQILPENA